MVFSGVIPVSGAPADPRTHRLWKMAESHGATVESGIGRHTTHVVAVRLGTAKVRLILVILSKYCNECTTLCRTILRNMSTGTFDLLECPSECFFFSMCVEHEERVRHSQSRKQ